jgi:hypothetical protein
MTASTTATMPLNSLSAGATARPLATSVDSIRTGLDADARELLSVLSRTLYLLGLGTIGTLAITGQPPLFLISLALFLFFGSCMQWGRSANPRARAEGNQSEIVTATSVRDEPFCGYEDKA